MDYLNAKRIEHEEANKRMGFLAETLADQLERGGPRPGAIHVRAAERARFYCLAATIRTAAIGECTREDAVTALRAHAAVLRGA